jgi:hypothetical protein
MQANLLRHFAGDMTNATLRAKTDGHRDAAGDWVEGAETESTVSILGPFPITGKMLAMFQQGTDVTNRRWFAISDSITLKVEGQDDATNSDTIDWGDGEYKVDTVKDWSAFGGFREVIVVKEDR